MKKWILRILNGLSAIIIVLAVLVLLRAVFSAGGVPTIGGYGFLRVLSGSMEPTIATNSMVIIHEEDPSTLQVGDIITFYSPDPELGGALNTHRIAEITQDEASGTTYFVTKGDANSLNDSEPVAAADVVGKVVFISGVLGLIVSLFSNPLIFIPFVMVPIALLLIYELWGTIKTAKEVARQEDEEALRQTVHLLRMKREAEEKAAAEAAEADAAVRDAGQATADEDGAAPEPAGQGDGSQAAEGQGDSAPEPADQGGGMQEPAGQETASQSE